MLQSYSTVWGDVLRCLGSTPPFILVLAAITAMAIGIAALYLTLVIVSPVPRPPYASEKTYLTSTSSGDVAPSKPLPGWYDAWERSHKTEPIGEECIGPAEVFMSVVVPAFNEEKRLEAMLEEAIAYLDNAYGRSIPAAQPMQDTMDEQTKSSNVRQRGTKSVFEKTSHSGGYEILLVNDGSKDETVNVALRIAHKHGLHDILRVVTLEKNRGKGGAVVHGFRHVRGQYAIFADADGASTFEDLGKLVDGCDRVSDSWGRGVAVGSRAHMVGSEAVIKRSALRNALMHSFHLLLRLLTPPATSSIRDTQCGFKLFSRASLPYIIPYMHAEGWIFDVEMLMLAESAPNIAISTTDSTKAQTGGPGIKVAEVAIGWKEVGGSKLNVMWDSLGMAYGLAVLRLSWALGVYKRR